MTCRERSAELDSADLQASWFLDDEKFKIRKAQTDFLSVTAHILEHSFYLDWQRSQFSLSIQISSSSFFIISNMSDESLLNNLNARIEAVIQCVMSNQECQSCWQSLTLIADFNSEVSKQFKLKEIRFFDFELNQNLDKDDIMFINKKVWIQNVFIFI